MIFVLNLVRLLLMFSETSVFAALSMVIIVWAQVHAFIVSLMWLWTVYKKSPLPPGGTTLKTTLAIVVQVILNVPVFIMKFFSIEMQFSISNIDMFYDVILTSLVVVLAQVIRFCPPRNTSRVQKHMQE